jgi:amino acid transporter
MTAMNKQEHELRRHSVPFIGVLAQAVGHMGPSAGIALYVALVFAGTGATSWLTWAFSTVIMLLVAIAISHFARRMSNTGDLYGFATKGGGSGLGIATAWSQLLFGVTVAGGGSIIFGLYVGDLLVAAHVPNNRGMIFLWCVLLIIATTYLTYRDVRLTARFMLVVEALSLAAIFLLMVVTLFHHHGPIIESQQFTFTGFSIHKLLLGMVLIVYAFSGFESCSTFGQEAKDPLRAIPRSLIVSVAVTGLLFVIAAYIVTLGFHGTSYDLATSSNPLADLSKINGWGPFQYVIDAGVAISIFSVAVAATNSTSRLMFTLSREQLFPAPFGRVSKRRLTPVFAIMSMFVLDIVILGLLELSNRVNYTWFGFISTFGGYGAIIAYIFICVAALGYLRKFGKLNPVNVLGSLIAIAALAYVLYASFHPVQVAPLDYLLYVFTGSVVAVGIVWAVLVARHSPIVRRVGTSVEEDTEDAVLDERAAEL